MADRLAEHAPAKVNLALHVTGRRADGYHLLDTLAVFTRAGDTVHVAAEDTDSLDIDGRFAGGLSPSNNNLVVRARDLLRRLAGDAPTPPVALRLEKNLPVASGIGGGSSDAAATLRLLCRHWGLDIAPDTLAGDALALGADLPMCLAARTLRAEGIGERLTPAEGWPTLHMVLVNPGVEVATPAVFRALRQADNPPLPAPPRRPDLAGVIAWLAGTRNDLQAPALSQAPVISECLEALMAQGTAVSRMSGSGATVFGLFASADAAGEAARTIAAARPSWYVAATQTIERA